MKARRHAVIMAGGRGTRFWPLSRDRRPKQFLKILGEKSLIRETVDRIAPLFDLKNILVVAGSDHVKEIRKELNMLPTTNFLLEPQGNNTAPCIGLAAIELTERDPNAIMMVLPADHWISDPGSFRRTVKAALQLTEARDALVTLGIRPSYPETGYGYILKGKAIKGPPGVSVYRVKAFKEKPTLKEASRLVQSGSLWNSGIFVWKVSTILEMLDRFTPRIYRALERINKGIGGRMLANPGPKVRSILEIEYGRMPKISIDHAVLEKAGSVGAVLTMEANFSWSDVGNWASLHQLLPHDREGNAAVGRWLGVDTRGCLVHSRDRLVVLLGMRDTMVVDTQDALLVGEMKRAQDIREVVKRLELKGYGRYLIK
ncbi:MAG: mannose-1-phosphate guanylyltransferase [Candidatus Binatia bacterium]